MWPAKAPARPARGLDDRTVIAEHAVDRVRARFGDDVRLRPTWSFHRGLAWPAAIADHPLSRLCWKSHAAAHIVLF
jgi:hypothetical protein